MERYKYYSTPNNDNPLGEHYALRCMREEIIQDMEAYAKQGFKRVTEIMPTGLRISRYEKIDGWKEPKLNVKA